MKRKGEAKSESREERLCRNYYEKRSQWEKDMAPLKSSLRILTELGFIEPSAAEETLKDVSSKFYAQTKRFESILKIGVVLKVYAAKDVWKEIEVPRNVTLDELAHFIFSLWGMDDSMPYGIYFKQIARSGYFQMFDFESSGQKPCFGGMNLKDGCINDARDLTLWSCDMSPSFEMILYGKYKDGCCFYVQYADSADTVDAPELIEESEESLDFMEKGNRDQWPDILEGLRYKADARSIRSWEKKFKELDSMTDKIAATDFYERDFETAYLSRSGYREEDW